MVALPQCTPVAPPGWQERRFHVEHAPIEKAPAVGWAILQHAMHARFEDLHDHRAEQIEAGRLAAIDPRLCDAIAPLHAKPMRWLLVACSNPAGHEPMSPADAGQVGLRVAAEGFAARQRVHRFEQAGLTGGIGAENETEPALGLQAQFAKQAEVFSPKLKQPHCRPCAQRRIGMTTYLLDRSSTP
jgi:hypothetical protein